jgi:hypothetical protein
VDCTPNKTGFSIRRKEQENISSTRLKMKQKTSALQDTRPWKWSYQSTSAIGTRPWKIYAPGVRFVKFLSTYE